MVTPTKPWDIGEERQLKDLFGEGKSVDQTAILMVKIREAALNKIYNLGLRREEEDKVHSRRLSSSFQLPAELPSFKKE